MFDFGFAELIIIIAIAVLVIGPDEIPVMMRSLGRIIRRLQYMRYALTQQFDDFMQHTELQDMQAEAAKRQSGDIDSEIAHDEADVQAEHDENTGNKDDAAEKA